MSPYLIYSLSYEMLVMTSLVKGTSDLFLPFAKGDFRIRFPPFFGGQRGSPKPQRFTQLPAHAYSC
jgi:hypothetical protein